MRCTSSAFPDSSGQCVLDVGHAGNHSLVSAPPPVEDAELERLLFYLVEHVKTQMEVRHNESATQGELDSAIAKRNGARAAVVAYVTEKSKDIGRLDWLEERGVESIYFRHAGQFNPVSMSLRSAIDSAMQERPQQERRVTYAPPTDDTSPEQAGCDADDD